MHDDAAEEWSIWLNAAGSEPVDAALRGLFASVTQDLAAGPGDGLPQPVCETSGRCCRFEAFGHRLYVTGLEIAWFVRHLTPEQQAKAAAHAQAMQAELADGDLSLPQLAIPVTGAESPVPVPGACVHQIDGLCDTHTIRPLGCRVFYCDETSDQWQHGLYETHQDTLRKLHDTLDVPYGYMEWRAGLAVAKDKWQAMQTNP